PAVAGIDHAIGDITDFHAVRAAAEGKDAVIFLVMAPPVVDTPESWLAHLGVCVPGLYTVLAAAQDAGIRHVVYASSLSVFQDWQHRVHTDSAQTPADARRVYGLAKRLGEDVLANA